jgi:hypothetical protein
MEPYLDDGKETSDHDEKKSNTDDFELIEHDEARYGYGKKLIKGRSRSLFTPILFGDPFFEGQGARSRIFIQTENLENKTQDDVIQFI